MKTVVLGGSSFSTPALFAALAPDCWTGCEFVLVGRSPEHLTAAARAADLVAGKNPPCITSHVCNPHTSREALDRADIVIVQIRVGGLRGRAFDESFPLAFGLCGDEGLGPGGLSAAWRAWPVLELWLAAIADYAPSALVLIVSSPVGILVRATQLRFPSLRCFGICEVPFVCLRDVCASLAVDWTNVIFEYLGVNHIGWLYSARVQDRNLVSEWAVLPNRNGFPSPGLIAEWGGIPTKYLRVHFESEDVLAAQRSASETRSAALARIQTAAYAAYRAGTVLAIRDAIAQRQTPWYADAVAPFLHALRFGRGDVPLFLSGPNNNYSSLFPDDDVLEMPYTVRESTLCRISPANEAPWPVVNLVAAFCRYERLATDAVLQRTTPLLETAVASHPWVAPAAIRDSKLVHSLALKIHANYAFEQE